MRTFRPFPGRRFRASVGWLVIIGFNVDAISKMIYDGRSQTHSFKSTPTNGPRFTALGRASVFSLTTHMWLLMVQAIFLTYSWLAANQLYFREPKREYENDRLSIEHENENVNEKHFKNENGIRTLIIFFSELKMLRPSRRNFT
jgi:hypothetical protein